MASWTPRKNKAGETISYQIKVSRGRDKLTGKQLTPYTMTYTPPEGWSKKAIERDLIKVAGEFEAACNRGEILTKEEQKAAAREAREQELKNPTFAQYIDIFLAEKALTIAPGTLLNYKNQFSHIKPFFDDLKISEIQPYHIKEAVTRFQSEAVNEKNGKPYSHAVLSRTWMLLHGLFSVAIENGIIQHNPMEGLRCPKQRKEEKLKTSLVYDEKQVTYIMDCLNKEPLKWRAMMLFAIDTGCRRGEIMGLKWDKVDLKTGACEIFRNRQYNPDTHSDYITTPKNGKGRTIFLNPPVLQILKEWKREQQINAFRLGKPINGYVFTHEDVEPMHVHAFTAYLQKFGKKYNLPGIHPHALRHTMATISIANGADIVSVSKKLGHANTAITLNVYSHANEEAQKRANEVLAEAIYIKKQA